MKHMTTRQATICLDLLVPAKVTSKDQLDKLVKDIKAMGYTIKNSYVYETHEAKLNWKGKTK